MAGIARNIGTAVSVGATSVITTVGLSATSSSIAQVQAQAVTQGMDNSLVKERLDQILLESKRAVLGLEEISEYEGLSEEDISID